MTMNQQSEGIDGAAQQLGALLAHEGKTLGVAESLTGGLLVQAMARLEGSGDWLAGGVVAYQRSVKHDLLDVRAEKVVSADAAAEMAVGARRRLGCDVGLAVTGVGGPDPQDGEPPGTVWMAVDVGCGPVTRLLRLRDEGPEAICEGAVAAALSLAAGELDAAHVHSPAPPDDAPDEPMSESVGHVGADDDGHSSPAASFWRRNALALVCFAMFTAFWFGQSLTGWQSAVADALEHGGRSFGYLHYVTTAHFAEATLENWESEFLQMGAFILLTIFLLQKGSAESKTEQGDPRDEDPHVHRNDARAPWPVRRGGLWLVLYENSLLIAFAVMFGASFVGHAISGAHEYSAEQAEHGASGATAWQFVRISEFWFQSFQNWQSEFLAVGSIVVLSVFLRQRGSAESKPVHASRWVTGDG